MSYKNLKAFIAWVEEQLSVSVSALSYTEKFEGFNAVGSGNWEDKDLSGEPFNVPANAVCEIVIGNSKNNAERNAGVRINGSGLNRILQIQECESGGHDFVKMTVKADADSIIEIYAEIASDITFWLLGYWS